MGIYSGFYKIEFECVKRETPKAYLISDKKGDEYWIPKSAMSDFSNLIRPEIKSNELYVKGWLLAKNQKLSKLNKDKSWYNLIFKGGDGHNTGRYGHDYGDEIAGPGGDADVW